MATKVSHWPTYKDHQLKTRLHLNLPILKHLRRITQVKFVRTKDKRRRKNLTLLWPHEPQPTVRKHRTAPIVCLLPFEWARPLLENQRLAANRRLHPSRKRESNSAKRTNSLVAQLPCHYWKPTVLLHCRQTMTFHRLVWKSYPLKRTLQPPNIRRRKRDPRSPARSKIKTCRKEVTSVHSYRLPTTPRNLLHPPAHPPPSQALTRAPTPSKLSNFPLLTIPLTTSRIFGRANLVSFHRFRALNTRSS